MKVLLISFSGRVGSGNCSKIMEHLSDDYRQKGVEVSLLYSRELSIQPCSGCNYECFDILPFCPIHDDVHMIYRKITAVDCVFFLIPVYSAAPPATYFAWRERAQGIFLSNEVYDLYQRVKKMYIIIGNAEAGGIDAVEILLKDGVKREDMLLLESHKYGQNSITGNLIELPEVQQLIREFVDRRCG